MLRTEALLRSLNNKLYAEDATAHEWYRFILSFPAHLVRDYVQRLGLDSNHCLLDPFCGTGTTIVECKKLGIPSIGIEANPMAHFASQVKIDWTPEYDGLIEHAELIAKNALSRLEADGIIDGEVIREDQRQSYLTLPPESFDLLLTDSISPRPLHKALVLLNSIRENYDERYYKHELLAFAKALVFSASNLQFGPEVGVSRIKKFDAPVVSAWQANVRAMANDLRELHNCKGTSAKVFCGDARRLKNFIKPNSIDAVITSPPYPNEKEYTRTTRLESVMLGFINNKSEWLWCMNQ